MTSSDRALTTKKIFWLSVSLSLLILALWLRFQHITSLGAGDKNPFVILTEAIAYGLLSFTLARFFNKGFLTHRRRYRVAFLTSSGVGLILFLTTTIILADPNVLFYLPLVVLCSFMGSFIASNLDKGWWENNAPPNPMIEKDVLAWHEAHMGICFTPLSKRMVDIVLSVLSLILSMPIWLLIIFLIWWEDPGPVLFIKNSVGLGGHNFKQLKFRSMIKDAEKETGPISGYEDDERVLLIGKFLRKTALDELPQLINILLGQMSYVGPRPQRTILVHGYLQNLPEYAARHRVRPGLSGLAQVTDSYSISPEEKLAWDLVYIDQMHIWLDVKLALAAFLLVFVLRWRSERDAEKTIRKLLRIKKPKLDSD